MAVILCWIRERRSGGSQRLLEHVLRVQNHLGLLKHCLEVLNALNGYSLSSRKPEWLMRVCFCPEWIACQGCVVQVQWRVCQQQKTISQVDQLIRWKRRRIHQRRRSNYSPYVYAMSVDSRLRWVDDSIPSLPLESCEFADSASQKKKIEDGLIEDASQTGGL